MKEEDQILFLAARQEFQPEHQTVIINIASEKKIAWERIFRAASHHGIGPLIQRNLAINPQIASFIPQNLLDQHRQAAIALLFLKQERTAKLEKALQFLEQKSLRAIILKGAALDLQIYEQPWYTVSNDIDLMINIKAESLNNRERKEIRTQLENTSIEYDFYSHHDFDMNGMLPVNYEDVWRRSSPIRVRAARAWVLAPEDFLISLCVNSCRKRFFRAKSLMDISETIQRIDNLNWHRFGELCRQYQCANIAYSALEVTRLTIGCQTPPDLQKQLGISPLRAANIRSVINFLLKTISLCYSSSKYSNQKQGLEPVLLLPYVTYHPKQTIYAIMQFIKKSFTSEITQE